VGVGHAWACLAAAAVLSGCASQAMPTGQPGAAAPAPLGPGLHPWTVASAGGLAEGWVAVPDAPSGTLVVVAKGYGARAEELAPLLRRLAGDGHLALAMEYRGERMAWKALEGAQDTVAATLAAQEAFGTRRTVLYGYSMGGEVSGLAVALAPPGTYGHWVAGSGVMDLAALWGETPAFRAAIEAAAGGTPADAPEGYRVRSPVEQADAVAGHGLVHAYLVHGAADAVVPPDHAHRMHDALAARGVPTTTFLVSSARDAAVCLPAVALCPAGAPVGPASHEAGWAAATMAVLDRVLQGGPDAPTGRFLVEGVTGAQLGLP
jgi:dienelactone hydrolase